MLRKSFVPLFLLALTLAKAADADQVLPLQIYPNEGSLRHGNGAKAVVGKFNSLHVVFEDADAGSVAYGFSEDDPFNPTDGGGLNWDFWYFNSSGASAPTVAVDSAGMAFVVWVKDADANGLGKIYYSRQTSIGCTQNWCWTTPKVIVNSGGEPSIVAQGADIHLAWTSRYQVRYATFAAAAAPSSPIWGEIVQYSVCPETRFHQPSVAVVVTSCQTVPKVAFLTAANEPQTFGPCTEGAQVGPQVFGRNMSLGIWSQMGDFRTPLSPFSPTGPNPVSLSLASNPSVQSLYLVWSDELDGSIRSQTTYSRGANWVWGAPVTLAPANFYVSARARASSAGQFRIAGSGLPTGPYPALSASAWYATGRWSNPAAPTLTWLDAPPQWMFDTYFTEGMSPQPLYWRKCTNASPRELKGYGLFNDSSWPDFATYEASPCNSPSITDLAFAKLCAHVMVAVGHLQHAGIAGDAGSILDFGEDSIVEASATGAVVKIGGATLRITWPSGKLLDSWENGFAVTAPANTLKIEGDAPYEIQDLGTVGGRSGK